MKGKVYRTGKYVLSFNEKGGSVRHKTGFSFKTRSEAVAEARAFNKVSDKWDNKFENFRVANRVYKRRK